MLFKIRMLKSLLKIWHEIQFREKNTKKCVNFNVDFSVRNFFWPGHGMLEVQGPGAP